MGTKEYYKNCCENKSDINEHMPMLCAAAFKCDHITEFGIRSVVSTWAFLMAKPKRLVSYDIYSHPNISIAKQCAEDDKISFEFKQEDTRKAIIERTDLLFIDTLHTYNQLIIELNRHHTSVKKYIILHDTETYGEKDEPDSYNLEKIESDKKHGLKAAIRDFLLLNKEWKIKYTTSLNNGLTILEKDENSLS